MPRTMRIRSSTGIYHVILRGINRQRIFEDGDDIRRFLELLKRYRAECGYELYAWCVMPNHVHLLIREGKEDLGHVFRRIGASFVYWYNLKYERIGHLFQDRYRSEPVEDETYLLTVLRYIHLNPVRAGLCKEPEDYPWSSFARYDTDPLISRGMVFDAMGEAAFRAYHHQENDDRCLEVREDDAPRLSDDRIRALMRTKYRCESVSAYQRLAPEIRGELLRTLLMSGASIRQLSRLTGETVGVVRKYSGARGTV